MFTQHDLLDFAQKIGKNKSGKSLSSKIYRLSHLHSIKFDLDKVIELCDHIYNEGLKRTGETNLSALDSLIDLSFFTTAVINYTKCTTSTDGKQRFCLNYKDMYQGELRGAHERIVGTRNTAVAHFGAGTHPGGFWADDKANVIIDNMTWRFNLYFSGSRANYRGAALIDLMTIVPVALSYTIAQIGELDVILQRELADLSPELFSTLLACSPARTDVKDRTFGHWARWTPLEG